MNYLYVILVLAMAVLFTLSMIVLRSTYKRNIDSAASINTFGMTRVSIIDILNARTFTKNTIAFPVNLNKYICKPSAIFLAKRLKEIATTEATATRNDIARAVTIAAAMFNKTIPYQLVYIDSRTKDLYIALLAEMQLVSVDVVDTWQQTTDIKHLERCSAAMVTIGALLMQNAENGVAPSFDNFAKYVLLNLPKNQTLNNDEIMAVTTAYAAITKIKIPKSYTISTALSAALMHPLPTTVLNKLSVVR